MLPFNISINSNFYTPFCRNAVQLCIKAHSCFPESTMFASLSTLTPENLMDTLALIFKGKSCSLTTLLSGNDHQNKIKNTCSHFSHFDWRNPCSFLKVCLKLFVDVIVSQIPFFICSKNIKLHDRLWLITPQTRFFCSLRIWRTANPSIYSSH